MSSEVVKVFLGMVLFILFLWWIMVTYFPPSYRIIVYDSATNKPLSHANVSLIPNDGEGGTIEAGKTLGRGIVDVQPPRKLDEYRIEVTKSQFTQSDQPPGFAQHSAIDAAIMMDPIVEEVESVDSETDSQEDTPDLQSDSVESIQLQEEVQQ